jgi:hypothetical protein
MMALSSANLLNNYIGIDQAGALTSILKEHTTLKSLCGNRGNETELDMSGMEIGAADAIMLAQEITNNVALASVNLLSNYIASKEAQTLANILKEHPALKSLCGNKGDETQLDMSSKLGSAAGAIMLAPEIINNGALSKLLLSKNSIQGQEAGKLLASMVGANTALKELDLSDQGSGNSHYALDAACAKELAVGLKRNKAMLSLHIEENWIGTKGAKYIASAIKVSECVASCSAI